MVGKIQGPFNDQEWITIKAKSWEIFRRSADRMRCWEKMKKHAEGLFSGISGEFASDLAEEGSAKASSGKDSFLLKDFRKVYRKESLSPVGGDSILFPADLERNSYVPGNRASDSWSVIKGGEMNRDTGRLCRIRDVGGINVHFFWKVPNQGLFRFDKYVNFVPFDTLAGDRGCYFESRWVRLCSPIRVFKDGKGESSPSQVDFKFLLFESGVGQGIQWGMVKTRENFQEIIVFNSYLDDRAISAARFRKLMNKYHLFCVKYVNPVVEDADFRVSRQYISTKSRGLSPPQKSSE